MNHGSWYSLFFPQDNTGSKKKGIGTQEITGAVNTAAQHGRENGLLGKHSMAINCF